MRNANVSLSSNDSDLTTVRDYIRALRIACGELHDEPFNASARAAIIDMLGDRGPTAAADRAFGRVKRTMR